MATTAPTPQNFEQFLAAIAGAEGAELRRLAGQAAHWRDELHRNRQTAADFKNQVRAPKGVYDRWIQELFHLTETATPVDALLRQFTERFSEIHELKQGRGPWVLVMEGYPPQGGSPWYFRLVAQAGLSPLQEKRFVEQDWSTNPLLQQCFSANAPAIDLWYLPYYRYEQGQTGCKPQPLEGGLFDGLFHAPATTAPLVSGNAWLSVQPLQEHTGTTAHVVFILYPNRGDLYEISSPPAGAGQDRRALDILVPVYHQLSGHLRRLAEDVERSKTNIMSRISPGLINHEIGGISRILVGAAADQIRLLDKIEIDYDDIPPEVELLRQIANSQIQLGEKLKKTAHAINNLDKRGLAHGFFVYDLFNDVIYLTRVLCSQVGVHLTAQITELTIHNDRTLLLHALLNLVMNALNAFAETPSTPDLCEIYLRVADQTEEFVYIEVANTGPEIDPQIRPKLFQRGSTSRQQGHGQGLFLVRRIAQYCGGDAELVTPQSPETVCFRLTISKNLDADQQL